MRDGDVVVVVGGCPEQKGPRNVRPPHPPSVSPPILLLHLSSLPSFLSSLSSAPFPSPFHPFIEADLYLEARVGRVSRSNISDR